jgi:hypothetical protein
MKNRVRYRVTNRNLSFWEEAKEMCDYEAKPSIYPLFEKCPFMSPYAYCNNNPINLIDLYGKQAILPDNPPPSKNQQQRLIKNE